MYKKKQALNLTAQMNSRYSDCIPSLDTVVVHKVRRLGQAQKSLIRQALGQVFVYNYQ